MRHNLEWENERGKIIRKKTSKKEEEKRHPEGPLGELRGLSQSPNGGEAIASFVSHLPQIW